MDPVFIVAQYKCGTSWLLSALSAHEQVLGIQEIDVVKAACDWKAKRPGLAPPEVRRRGFFGSSAWCNFDATADLERGEHPRFRPTSLSRPQCFQDLERGRAIALYRAVMEARSDVECLDAFLDAVSIDGAHSHVVLKAADQIACFDVLQRWKPNAKKIAVTRDGRDAAISALHFRKLMTDRPWFGGEKSYQQLLKDWTGRAAMIVDRARRGELAVIRYEDLSRDFPGTFGPLLEWLGLPGDEQTVAAIDAATCFEAVTGRARGNEAAEIVRKGQVGEWRGVLDAAEAREAWSIASEPLRALGYTEGGDVEPLQGDMLFTRHA